MAKSLWGVLVFELVSASAAFGLAGQGGEEGITCYCTNGGAHCMINGQRVPAQCGQNTPNKTGTIPEMKPCIGTSFACMAGKECIEIEGAYKFHKTRCGSGGGTPNGTKAGAGCVILSDADFAKVRQMQGKKFQVINGDAGRSGRQ